MKTELLQVTGMTCGSCANKVTNALKAVAGVLNVTVSLPTKTVSVQFDEQRADLTQLRSAIAEAGYGVEVEKKAGGCGGGGGCCCH
ncbi:MAG TPA: heavy-metal-associated domain-containing protein [Noviherbaspirillum sp.]